MACRPVPHSAGLDKLRLKPAQHSPAEAEAGAGLGNQDHLIYNKAETVAELGNKKIEYA